MILVIQVLVIHDFVTIMARDLAVVVVDLIMIYVVYHLYYYSLIMKNHYRLMDLVLVLIPMNYHPIVLALLRDHFFHLIHHQNQSHNDILNHDNRHLYCNHVFDMHLLYVHLIIKKNLIILFPK